MTKGSNVVVAPYGAWQSPLGAATVSSAQLGLSDLRAVGDDVFWVEMRPSEGGRQVVVRHRAGDTIDMTPSGFNARTRVHEYGGAPYVVAGDALWFTNFSDQRLWRVDQPGAEPKPMTSEGPWRYADLIASPDGAWIICVRETHPPDGLPSGVRNDLVALPAAGGDPVVLRQGRDFYSSPRLSRDGTQLAWIEWDFPDMPWDDTELHTAAFADGRLDRARHVAGGHGESVQQPAYDDQARLLYVSDLSGWWNIHRDGDGPLHDDQVDVGLPMWEFGMSSYAPLDTGDVAVSVFAAGTSDLAVLTDGRLQRVRTRRHPEFAVVAHGDGVVFIGASPYDSEAVVRLDLASGEETVLRESSDLAVPRDLVARGQHITAPVGEGDVTHALYYPPTNPEFDGPPDERPPLVVFTHGGPTAHVMDGLDARKQFWTSRGIAVVDVNYRGSTGYGRAYRKALDGRWGITDIEDVVAVVDFLARRGDIDRSRVAIRGGSAGGYTTLRALTSCDVFAAGASYFGVADIGALAAHTHKFESRYIERLVPPAAYDERSPINHVDQLSTPLLVLQGLEDAVVPPEQAEMMVAALDAKGVAHSYLAFEGEQHGFRKAANLVRSLEAELGFYGRVLGFEPADELPPLDITHLD